MPEPDQNQHPDLGRSPPTGDLFSHDVMSDAEGTHEQNPGLEHKLRGEILRVVYTSDDGQYVVLRLVDEKYREHTLVGPLGGLLEGQDIEVRGRWESHQQHGRQLRVTGFRAILPSSVDGIRRYLASGLIPGIGPKLAERIVDRFGVKTLDVLENTSARLREVPGLGKKRIGQVRESWLEHCHERDVRIFLQGLGVGAAMCGRIVRRFGVAAAETVKRNPYALASEVRGIGFLTADRIAHELGIEKTDPKRLAAGSLYTLERLADQGHTCFPEAGLVHESGRILDVEDDRAREGIERAALDGAVIKDADTAESGETFHYRRSLYVAETDLAASLARLLESGASSSDLQVDLRGSAHEQLNEAQLCAIRTAACSGISVVTGGPGVGKTTVVGRLVTSARACGHRVLLAAPTGRAAKRLSESSGCDAKTIHRLLRWDPAERRFVHNRESPLRCDLLIVDEVSMLDVVLANHLFQAVAPGTHVVLVGDRDQLPSVGPGFFLHDLIASETVPVTHLSEIYRQTEGSRIVLNAHAVNQGRMPSLATARDAGLQDFYWIEQDDPERVVEIIARMVSDRIPHSFGFNPLSDVQVLAPMHRGSCGAVALNELLQRELNPGPGRGQLTLGERVLRVGDRVMQTANNYDKGVFNGELGQVAEVDPPSRTFSVAFDVGRVQYEWHEADQVRLAYAITVHKSQGSEFPVVVMPLLTQHYIMLQRNLVYTGMTRARRLLVMIGTRKALAIAIRNDRPMMRHSLLSDRLKALHKAAGSSRAPTLL